MNQTNGNIQSVCRYVHNVSIWLAAEGGFFTGRLIFSLSLIKIFGMNLDPENRRLGFAPLTK